MRINKKMMAAAAVLMTTMMMGTAALALNVSSDTRKLDTNVFVTVSTHITGPTDAVVQTLSNSRAVEVQADAAYIYINATSYNVAGSGKGTTGMCTGIASYKIQIPATYRLGMVTGTHTYVYNGITYSDQTKVNYEEE